MFEKGDLIAGLEGNSQVKANEGMTKAEVICVIYGNPVTMGIIVLEHEDESVVGDYWEVENQTAWFKLVGVLRLMECVNNRDYEDCLTIGKMYEIEIVEDESGKMYKFKDDNEEPLQTMIERFI